MAGNPFIEALAAKSKGMSGTAPADGQAGGGGKGLPPQFLNRGRKKKHGKGKQEAIARRLAAMKGKK
jgi:hypothetical protein